MFFDLFFDAEVMVTVPGTFLSLDRTGERIQEIMIL